MGAAKRTADPVIADPDSPLAEDSEALLTAAMSHKIDPVHLKGGEALDRTNKVIFVFNKEGKITGATTPRGVRDGAARVAAIQTTMQDGVRPDVILCIDCKVPREVHRGAMPKRCAQCSRDEKAKRAADRARLLRATEPDAIREKDRQRRTTRGDAIMDADRKWRASNQEKRRETCRKSRAKSRAENPGVEREKSRIRYSKNIETERNRARVRRENDSAKMLEASRKYKARKKAEREAEKAKATKGSE